MKLAFVLATLAFGMAQACEDVWDCTYISIDMCTMSPVFTQNCAKTCNVCGPPQPPTFPPPPPPTQAPVPDPQPDNNCGRPEVYRTRVIAGQNARRGSWPWQILMFKNGRAGCGGTLVSNQWVVTAAHCVSSSLNPRDYTVRVGEHDRTWVEGSELDYAVDQVIMHYAYDKHTMNNDIAMFKLQQPVQFNKYVQPACLPSGPASGPCYITGWGKTRHPGGMEAVLQQAELKMVDNSECERYNRRGGIPFTVTDAMLCAGDGGGGRKSGCHGDSGGPFVCQNRRGQWELRGAVSYGSSDCEASKTHSVFANIAHFKDWIKRNMT